jgi:hypothetical protein
MLENKMYVILGTKKIKSPFPFILKSYHRVALYEKKKEKRRTLVGYRNGKGIRES